MFRFATLLSLALLAGCFQSALSALSERIGEQARAQGRVELASLTDFEWDTVFIFSPYATSSVICDAVGNQWPECARQAPKQVSESNFHLVFTHQGKFVSQVVHARINGNFCAQTCALSISKPKAIFHVSSHPYTSSSSEPPIYLLTETAH